MVQFPDQYKYAVNYSIVKSPAQGDFNRGHFN